ncbi:hypothetical protein AMK19_13830 [Kitasatospora sp. CB01950]|nr:hypothetical protein AMK19_13830 [Kitasatospora sp. CB01950]
MGRHFGVLTAHRAWLFRLRLAGGCGMLPRRVRRLRPVLVLPGSQSVLRWVLLRHKPILPDEHTPYE